MSHRWPERPRALLSYAFLRGKELPALADHMDIIIDSGAFTAHSTGKAIDRDAYTEWLGRHRNRFTTAFALDVIGNPRQSLANYRAQARSLPGVTLIPTWHIGSPWSDLETLLGEARIVAIGGAVPYSNKQRALMRTFIKAHKMARSAGVRLHGLGQTSIQAMYLPWASVDSSSWLYSRRYPMLLLANQHGRIVSLKRGSPDIVKHSSLVRSYGLNVNVVRNSRATMAAHVGSGVAAARVAEYAKAGARAYYLTEAVSPHQTKVYLAAALEDLNDPIRQAWQMGSPFQKESVPV